MLKQLKDGTSKAKEAFDTFILDGENFLILMCTLSSVKLILEFFKPTHGSTTHIEIAIWASALAVFKEVKKKNG